MIANNVGFHARLIKLFLPRSVPLQEFGCRPQQAVVCSAVLCLVGALLRGSGGSGLYGHVLHAFWGLLPQQGLPGGELEFMLHRVTAGYFTLHSDMWVSMTATPSTPSWNSQSNRAETSCFVYCRVLRRDAICDMIRRIVLIAKLIPFARSTWSRVSLTRPTVCPDLSLELFITGWVFQK